MTQFSEEAWDEMLGRPEPGGPLTAHALRRLAIDDVTDAERKVLLAALSDDEAARSALVVLRAEADVFVATHPYAAVRDSILARAAALPAPPNSRFAWSRLRVLLFAAAACCVLLALPLLRPSAPPTEVRTKGGALTALRLRDGMVAEATTLRAGDRVQLRAVVSRPYVLAFAQGGGGPVTAIVEEHGLSVHVGAGSRLLSGAWSVDGAGVEEVFFVVESDRPLSAAATAERLAAGDLSGLDVQRLTIPREP